jgi:hypothetical protein
MKRALIVGPSYPAPYTLLATANNIQNWTVTLQARGFGMRTILAGQQSRGQIQAAIQGFIASLGPADSGALVLLGHGGRVADSSGDEADGYDEAFAASDIQPITDDWLRGAVASCATPNLDIVADMCYAGTSTREVGDAPQLDPNIWPLKAVKFPPRREARDIVPAALNHRLWAACRESETAYTCMSGGLYHSIFSLYLCWALRTYPTKTAEQVLNLVSGYISAYQHPQLEGINFGAVPF